MKKITQITLLIIFAVTVSAHAQTIYLKIASGYAFAMPGEKVDQAGNVLNGSVSSFGSGVISYDLKNASFTSGVPVIIGAGLMLSKNIGVELNAAINITTPDYTARHFGETTSSGLVYNYAGERQAKNPVIILPALLLQTANSKWNIYMKMGVALPVNTKMNMHEIYQYQTGDVHIYDWDIKNYFSLGFTAATGLKMNVGENISLFGEVSMMYLNVSRKERDLTAADINGQTVPISQLTGVKIYNYHKNGVDDLNGNQEALSQPFSNLGLNVGLCYILKTQNKKKK
jgi:hypothetical protein